MSSPAPSRTAFCSTCGRPARVVGSSLDPRYPMVRCSRISDDGTEVGHGNVPGLTSEDAADKLVELRKRARITKQHDVHVRAGRVNAWCDRCKADPPPSRATVHRYAAIDDRFRLASHLEFSHADRTMRVNLLTRPLEPMAEHHRKLHDEALARP